MHTPLSAVIITYNAAEQLEDCLRSLSFVDEILVLDSGSTDETERLARKHDARFVCQEWLGYGPQKQKAVELAANDWVLCVDADEQISSQLASSIRAAMKDPEYRAYQLSRCNRFLGRWLRHGEGYPDRLIRLFNRHFANWSDDPVHEYVSTNEKVGVVKGDLLHDSAITLQEYLEKQNRYTSLQAERMFREGRRAASGKLVFNPAFRFIKFYIFRMGLLDGLPGLIHILIGCQNTFMKYAKLIELQKSGKSRGTKP
jgi:glycosyltransferase involved in cell wall biosynthesis